jgi:hypothetical protein
MRCTYKQQPYLHLLVMDVSARLSAIFKGVPVLYEVQRRPNAETISICRRPSTSDTVEFSWNSEEVQIRSKDSQVNTTSIMDIYFI